MTDRSSTVMRALSDGGATLVSGAMRDVPEYADAAHRGSM